MDFPEYRIHGAAPGGREAELEAALVERDATIKALLERIAELERRLGLDSSNSGKPPSSDGLRKPNAGRGVERRGKSSGGESSGRKPGGQPGRAGKTLKRSDEPGRVEDHYPDRCGSCGERLGKDGSVHFAARQVFDLPPPPALEVVERRAHACAACGGTTRAAFPEGADAPIQYGSRISALILYFGGLQMLPRKRLAEMMGEVFGASLSQGAVSAILRRGGEACASFAERVRDLAAHAPVKHMDETGVRVEGRLRWLRVASTGLLCHFRLGESRGDAVADAAGIAVHDFWKPYFTIRSIVHALCIAHILRELKQRVEFDGEAWAGRMAELLRGAVHEINAAGRAGEPFPSDLAERVGKEYDIVVAEGVACHDALPPPDSPGRKGRRRRRKGHSLAIRMRDFREPMLRFARDPTVPATNNEAERDLRMYKVQQKISGCCRSVAGAVAHANLRTLAETARKQNWNVPEALGASPAALVAKLKTS